MIFGALGELSLGDDGGATVPPGTLAPVGIASAEAFGSPVITPYWLFDVGAIASGEAFGTPQLDLDTLSPDGIASAEAFGTPGISPWFILPAGIATAEAFGTTYVNEQISPPSITSLEAFGEPIVYHPVFYGSLSRPTKNVKGINKSNATKIYLRPTGIASVEAFGITVIS